MSQCANNGYNNYIYLELHHDNYLTFRRSNYLDYYTEASMPCDNNGCNYS